MIGWLSWLVVATHLYAFAWWSIDSSSYFVLPVAAYEWLEDLVGPTTQEATSDLEVWSTAMVMVLGLHVIAWIIYSRLRLARRPSGVVWRSWQGRILAVIGWTSWLLVSTFALFAIGDAIYEAHGGKLSNETGKQLIEFFGGVLVVGSLHLAVLKIARQRRS
jgi:hypothetical protein